VSGPYAPDTIFLRGYKGEFDAVIALYHDQATVAVKSLSFGSGVNVTLGLPLIRTSVDHGTAYDIAGKNVADPSSMVSAIELAADLVRLSPKFAKI
jgi:4-hydroxythreonine-4-phosphate dehydrogenase